MATTSFQLSLEIGAAPAAVHAVLGDFEQLRVLHPLIESVQGLAAKPERPLANRYRVVDRMRVGPLRYRTAYIAELHVVSNDEIEGRAWQGPWVELCTTYRVGASERGARIREATTLTTPWPLSSFVRRQAAAAHLGMLENLRAHLEAEA